MTDMLIKLYDLPDGPAEQHVTGPAARLVRKPIGPEHDAIVAWVQQIFGARWASEARVALTNRPVSLFIAMQGAELIGFACYDATARGCVGPIGVQDAARGSGIGAALLRATLADMRASGYGYAIAGAVGPKDFFSRVAGATDIADSTPGLYAGMFRGQD
ncbi:MAG: GNAT family N-acetyltransferase [Burkholderiaceae bacterium]|nr:GNAT family N-acetyltransferase [Burkholderiaceae bacterium]